MLCREGKRKTGLRRKRSYTCYVSEEHSPKPTGSQTNANIISIWEIQPVSYRDKYLCSQSNRNLHWVSTQYPSLWEGAVERPWEIQLLLQSYNLLGEAELINRQREQKASHGSDHTFWQQPTNFNVVQEGWAVHTYEASPLRESFGRSPPIGSLLSPE